MEWKFIALALAVALAGCVNGAETGGKEANISVENKTVQEIPAAADPLALDFGYTEDYDLNLSLCLSGKSAMDFLPNMVANIPKTTHPQYEVGTMRVLNFTRKGVNVAERSVSAYAAKIQGKERNFVEIFVEEYATDGDYAKEASEQEKAFPGEHVRKNASGLNALLKEAYSPETLMVTESLWTVFVPSARKILSVTMKSDIDEFEAPRLLKAYLYGVCLTPAR